MPPGLGLKHYNITKGLRLGPSRKVVHHHADISVQT